MSKQVLAIIGAIVSLLAIAGVAYLAITKYMEKKRLEEYYYDEDDCYYDCDDCCDDCCDDECEVCDEAAE